MKTFLISLRMILAMTVLTGVAYPLALTGLAQVIFHRQANGSFVERNGQPVGSVLVGQKFASVRYFWPRPSAVDYNPLPSSGSNLGPTSAAMVAKIAERRAHFASTGDPQTVPPDLLQASGSGLDPHISPAGALYQVPRVLSARGVDGVRAPELEALIEAHTEGPQWSLFGEPRVNVLLLNLALDSLLP
jgi:K+-transporting ATPase ATPase C chain